MYVLYIKQRTTKVLFKKEGPLQSPQLIKAQLDKTWPIHAYAYINHMRLLREKPMIPFKHIRLFGEKPVQKPHIQEIALVYKIFTFFY